MPKRKPPENPYPTTEILMAMARESDAKALKYLVDVFKLHDGKIYETASALGVHRDVLYRVRDASPAFAEALEKHGHGKNFDELTWKGMSLSRTAWAKELGISRAEFQRRLSIGKQGEDLFAPAGRKRPKAPSKKKPHLES